MSVQLKARFSRYDHVVSIGKQGPQLGSDCMNEMNLRLTPPNGSSRAAASEESALLTRLFGFRTPATFPERELPRKAVDPRVSCGIATNSHMIRCCFGLDNAIEASFALRSGMSMRIRRETKASARPWVGDVQEAGGLPRSGPSRSPPVGSGFPLHTYDFGNDVDDYATRCKFGI